MALADDKSAIESQLKESARVKLALLDHIPVIVSIVDIFATTVSSGGTIYSCGNGGSACDAMHIAEELVARYLRERPGIRAQHLCDPAVMTCWSNDYDFAGIFERQVRTYLTQKDVLLALSTSGNSENIVRALSAAREIKAHTVLLSGRDGGRAKSLADIALVVSSDVTARIQEAHSAVIHVICDQLELRLFG